MLSSAEAQDFNPLPDTGKFKCYDVVGNTIPCPSEGQPLYGQDGCYQGATPSYTDNGNETDEPVVSDRNTGLMWMKNSADVNNDGRFYSQDKLNWWNAKKYCEDLVGFAGYSDWRLPTLFELQSIVDYGRYRPAINPVFSCQQNYYWSATTDARDVGYAWNAGFSQGDGGRYAKGTTCYVRCVRGFASNEDFTFKDNGDGTVYSNETGLTWQLYTADVNDDGKPSAQDKAPWSKALSYCEDLNFAGYSDWRLPNIRELLSIVDHKQYDPTIDPIFKAFNEFSEWLLSSPYWSSTTCMNDNDGAYDEGDAWNVFFSDGNDYWADKKEGNFVRCVRGGLYGNNALVPTINYLLIQD